MLRTRKALEQLYGHVERLAEILENQQKIIQKHSMLIKELIGEDKYPAEVKKEPTKNGKDFDKAYR